MQVLYGHFVADYKPRLILYLALSQTAIFIFLFGSFFRYALANEDALYQVGKRIFREVKCLIMLGE